MKRHRIFRRRGNAMTEFALASAVLLPIMTGTFQFGYSLYLYNLLESAVANGAQFGALRTYRSLTSADVTKGETAIKNMVVYGSPSGGTTPLVKGLTTSNVQVTYGLVSGLPVKVKVNIVNFNVDAIFKTYNFNNKPAVTYPFAGRYAPNESEP